MASHLRLYRCCSNVALDLHQCPSLVYPPTRTFVTAIVWSSARHCFVAILAIVWPEEWSFELHLIAIPFQNPSPPPGLGVG
jgi:hypothetical protein